MVDNLRENALFPIFIELASVHSINVFYMYIVAALIIVFCAYLQKRIRTYQLHAYEIEYRKHKIIKHS